MLISATVALQSAASAGGTGGGLGLGGGGGLAGGPIERPLPLVQVSEAMLTLAQNSLLLSWMARTYMPATGTLQEKLYPPAQHPLEPTESAAAPEAGTSAMTSPSSTLPEME